MYLRRNGLLKYSAAVVIGVLIFTEWFVYHLQSYSWQNLTCREENASCTRILFVADPQIQGDLAVPFPLNLLFNWDSDRYLKKTFSLVVRHFKPHVIVYLGDLMDEGSISTMVQFHAYVKRLFDIFEVDYPVKQVWLPGDNDIGGENEPIRRNKIEEFNKVFIRPETISFRNIMFIEVNGITHTMPTVPFETVENYFRIVVSHYPITDLHVFGTQVYNKFRPHIFFCAHDHDSKYVRHTRDMRNREVRRRDFSQKTLELTFDNESLLYEVYVPTCSYRMGTLSIGYGAALLDTTKQEMEYTVFWSPQRFPYLFVYLAIVVSILLYSLLLLLKFTIHRWTASSASSDTIPFLKSVQYK